MLFDELMVKKPTKKEIDFYNSMTASRRNAITRAVSCKLSKDDFKPNTDAESWYFDSCTQLAEAHLEKYGDWPVFEMEEIEWEDPVLDIYRDPIN